MGSVDVLYVPIKSRLNLNLKRSDPFRMREREREREGGDMYSLLRLCKNK